jgi:hypothetical protein
MNQQSSMQGSNTSNKSAARLEKNIKVIEGMVAEI